jgi:hypothetical protein
MQVRTTRVSVAEDKADAKKLYNLQEEVCFLLLSGKSIANIIKQILQSYSNSLGLLII